MNLGIKKYFSIDFIIIYLIILNFLDLLFTYLGLKFEIIEESNVIMKALYEKGDLYFILPKLLLSIPLFYIYYYIKKSSKLVLNKTIVFIYRMVLFMYFIIFCIHLFWIFIYLFLN